MLLKLTRMVNIGPAIKDAFSRFPIPFIFIVAATLIALSLTHQWLPKDEEIILRTLATLLYGAFALTSLKLLVESNNWSISKHAIGIVIIMGWISLYVWDLLSAFSASTYLFFTLTIFLSLIFAPYIQRSSTQASFWYFNYLSADAIRYALLASLMLGAGISLILISVGYLFELTISPKLYADTWILSMGLLFPIYIFANLSREFDFDEEECSGFPQGISFITNYILAPLMLAYMAILYAYFIKIILQWELPRGNLGWMITTFGSIGILTKLIAYPIRDKGTRLLSLFDRYFYYALLVPIILLALAIGVRINQYGVTEQRYMVVLVGIWFTIVSLATVIKRAQFHIKYVPMVLALLSLFATFGPWGVAEVSFNSQISRFESLLLKNQLLINGRLHKTDDESQIPFDDRKAISSVAAYLCTENHRKVRVTKWIKNVEPAISTKSVKSVCQSRGRKLTELIGISFVRTNPYSSRKNQNRDGHISFQRNFNFNGSFLNVAEYDYIGQGSLYAKPGTRTQKKFGFRQDSQRQKVTIALENNMLSIQPGTQHKIEFDLGLLLVELKKRGVKHDDKNDLANLTLSKHSPDKTLHVKVLLNKIQGTVDADSEISVTNVRYIMLLKIN